MSTTEEFNPEDYEGITPKTTTIHPAELRKLRKEAEQAKEYKAQLEAATRREMFREAGVPITPATEYFIRGYEGELTPEAIKAKAVEVGFLSNPGATPEEIAAHQQATAIAAGAQPPNLAPDFAAKLQELSRKQFGPNDEAGRAAHINEIARLAKEAGAHIPVNI